MAIYKDDKQYRVIDDAGRFYTIHGKFDNYIHYYGVKFTYEEANTLAKRHKAKVVKEYWKEGQPIYAGQWLEIMTTTSEEGIAWFKACFVGYDHDGWCVFSLHHDELEPMYMFDSWDSLLLSTNQVREIE